MNFIKINVFSFFPPPPRLFISNNLIKIESFVYLTTGILYSCLKDTRMLYQYRAHT